MINTPNAAAFTVRIMQPITVAYDAPVFFLAAVTINSIITATTANHEPPLQI